MTRAHRKVRGAPITEKPELRNAPYVQNIHRSVLRDLLVWGERTTHAVRNARAHTVRSTLDTQRPELRSARCKPTTHRAELRDARCTTRGDGATADWISWTCCMYGPQHIFGPDG